MITPEELREALNTVDWKILETYNGLNQWFVNPNGEKTGFHLWNGEFKEEYPEEFFGIRNKYGAYGNICVGLRNSELRIEKNYVAIGDFNGGAFLMFYKTELDN